MLMARRSVHTLPAALAAKGLHDSVTLALLKPDLLASPHTVRNIVGEIQRTPGLRIVGRAGLFWTRAQAEAFYHEHSGRFFFRRLVAYMTSGPIEALALRGPRAVARWREMMGSTHPVRMRVANPACLRARYGLTDTRNSFHGSDSPASAARELAFVFGEQALREMAS
ncbi:hypothetical protein H4R26_005762 [Coemansia thaxteri]|uniref:Nucleoside diphosphate kinase n=1 Tax=Coemansia thaxteri TaxID=2663907 RepID=A0A9W8EFJ8_9FUNG|nr:hypothetical protein H4R26_005762 [Coemansia thaxteri]